MADNSVSTEKFTLFFENGSGMENTNDAIHIARRTILLTVINDFEKFIPRPKPNQHVNLWIRNINKVPQFVSSHLSRGSSFYNVAKSNTGSLADGEVFKSLLSGNSSYINVVNMPTQFYHGFLAFNFPPPDGNPITWHTDLNTVPSAESYDLYSAILKECTHLLGFCSLINANGASVFGDEYQYFSRYDKFLKNENQSQPLLISENTNGLYDYSFNVNLFPQILRPNCLLIDNISYENSDSSNCDTALWYKSPNVKARIYTPDCFQPGYSFSCLEDQLEPKCGAPYGNNLHFATSNNLISGIHKRYLKSEERIILTDIGFKVSTTFGTETTFAGLQTYSNNADAVPLQVIGINDGINEDLTFRFVGNAGDGIDISGASLLENDLQANSFVGLQCLTNGGSVSIETGNFGSNLVFNSISGGLYLLRYIPSNGFQNGNITYFYVYMNANNNCGTPIACQSIVNGNFESFVELPTFSHQIEKACNWKNFAGAGMMSADYNHMNSPAWQSGVPVNSSGFQNDNIAGNGAYATLVSYYWPNFPNFPHGVQTSTTISQIIKTKLTSPMQAGKKYKISYQVSKADNYPSGISIALQAFITASNFQPNLLNFLSDTQIAQGSLYTHSNADGTPAFITSTTVWTALSFDHTAVGGEEFLYIGALNNAPTPNPPVIGGSNFFARYFYDNVSVRIVEEAANDNFTFGTATTLQISATSILNNDNFNGSAANITIAQTPNPHPFLSINSNGTVTVAANTPVGTYVVNYTITSSCGTSNVASVTVVVQNNVVTTLSKTMGPAMCTQNSILITDTPLSPNTTWATSNVYYINGVPAVMGQLQWFPVGTITPSCLTLNTNGSITVQPNCIISSNPNVAYEFYMKACDINNPNMCSSPIRVNGYIGPAMQVDSNHQVFVNQNGVPYPNPYNGSQYSGPMNVLVNARLCALQPSISQVVLTQNSSNGPWQLNENTGNIFSPTGNYPLGQSTVNYTICEIGNPSNCATGQITIYIVN